MPEKYLLTIYMSDLFDVFTEAAPAKENLNLKKRQLSKTETEQLQTSQNDKESIKQSSSQNKDENTTRKRAKPEEEPEPLVTDSFETEAHKEYSESAGLLGSTPSEGHVVVSHQVRHQVALPPNFDYVPISQHKITDPARTYPFTLDPFQAVSISSIDRNESVLVSAHTSAGKTVVAEYAIAQSLRAKQRVIYTSPIKALSNQKYRELLAEFGEVGLMTGDVTINPDASCLVMTTEILRSMLYRGSEIMREVSWVIFDEIHYMRDKSRGVVWEETIILLPDNVRYVFLSATIPNAMQFAEWICKIHEQPCHVVYTNFRPTPLQHYLFPAGGSGIHLVVDEKGTFREENFQKAMGSLGERMGEDSSSALAKTNKKGEVWKGGVKSGTPDIYKIIKMIMLRNYNPVIVFSFSKRECEQLALKMSKLDFNTDDEHDAVEKVFENAIAQLSEEDQQLPQIKHLVPLLKRGIGVHHSGLLPILKEVIEILFQEGLIKVLFATETFSIGLNMPAKTVVFTNVRKWDGVSSRWISGGEYIQMSGRAGRRGLDDRGIVILMIDEQMDPPVAKSMVKGEADRLDSAFHLTYNMIVNLLRVEGISPEYMLERCFYQFQSVTSIPKMEAELETLHEQHDHLHVDNEEQIKQYYDIRAQIDRYAQDMRKVITHPSNVLSFLQSGRLVKISIKIPKAGVTDESELQPVDFGWAIVVGFNKRRRTQYQTEPFTDHQSYVVEVLVKVAASSPIHLIRKNNPQMVEGIRPPNSEDEQTRTEVLPITLDCIEQVANIRAYLPSDLSSVQQRNAVSKSLSAIEKRFPDGLPPLDPVESMKITDDEFLRVVGKLEVLESRLAEHPLHKSENLSEQLGEYSVKADLEKSIVKAQKKVEETRSIVQLDELKSRKRVLRRLGFTDEGDIVQLKGRVACEISSGDELMLTELIFNGTFTDLTPEQCAALLSVFVFDEKVKDSEPLKPDLQRPYDRVIEMAHNILRVSKESKLDIKDADYLDSFKWQLMDVVYQWAKGAKFAQICKMTEVYEGSLIRVFRRLEELLRQMVVAAKTIDNTELADKMTKAMELIKRDMVSSASLYL